MRTASMIPLNAYAKALKVHPITVLRALEGEVGVSWWPGYNPLFDVDHVADSLKIEPNRLRLIMRGKDRVMTRQEAIEFVGRCKRAFTNRRYPAMIRTPRMTRYSYHQFMNHHIQHWVKD